MSELSILKKFLIEKLGKERVRQAWKKTEEQYKYHWVGRQAISVDQQMQKLFSILRNLGREERLYQDFDYSTLGAAYRKDLEKEEEKLRRFLEIAEKEEREAKGEELMMSITRISEKITALKNEKKFLIISLEEMEEKNENNQNSQAEAKLTEKLYYLVDEITILEQKIKDLKTIKSGELLEERPV